MAMRICKECGNEVSSKGVCQKCGRDQRSFFAKHKVITFILIVIILGVVIGATGGKSNQNQSIISSSTQENEVEKITIAKFENIQTVMTYQDVVDIIGEEGTTLSESNIGNDEKYHTIIYSWKAKNGIANANVTFQGGKVVSKAQVGLQ